MEDGTVPKSLLPINNPFSLLHASIIRAPLFYKYLHAIHQELSVDLDVARLRKNIDAEQRKLFDDLCRARLYLIAGSPIVMFILFLSLFRVIGIQVDWQQSALFMLGFIWGMIFRDMILWVSHGQLKWMFALWTLYLFSVFLVPFLTLVAEGILIDYPYSHTTFEIWIFLRQSLPILHPFSIDGILTSAGAERDLFSAAYGIVVGLCSSAGMMTGLATSILIMLTGGLYVSVEWWIVFGFFSIILITAFIIIVSIFFEERRNETTKSLVQSMALVIGVGLAGSLTASFYTSMVYAVVWGSTMGLTAGRVWSAVEALPPKSTYRRVIIWGPPLIMVFVIAGFVALSVIAGSSMFVLFGVLMSLSGSIAFCGSWIIAHSISYTRLPLYLLWEVPVSFLISLCAALSPTKAREFWRWQPITYDEYAMFPILGTKQTPDYT